MWCPGKEVGGGEGGEGGLFVVGGGDGRVDPVLFLVWVLGGDDAGFWVGVPAVDDGVAGFGSSSGVDGRHGHGYVEGGLEGCGCCEEEYQVEEVHDSGMYSRVKKSDLNE